MATRVKGTGELAQRRVGPNQNVTGASRNTEETPSNTAAPVGAARETARREPPALGATGDRGLSSLAPQAAQPISASGVARFLDDFAQFCQQDDDFSEFAQPLCDDCGTAIGKDDASDIRCDDCAARYL